MASNEVMVSRYAPLAQVAFPAFAGRQFYMYEFDLSDPQMPEGYEDYRDLVRSLCGRAGATIGTAFLTVDEKVIAPGMSQRRPGPHVDGCFQKDRQRWGHGGWNHYCNALPMERMPVIVASDVAGCKAWSGDFAAAPRNDGDLSHVALPEGELLPANVGYLLSPDCIHESLTFTEPTQRSFIRIALPTDFPALARIHQEGNSRGE